MTVEWDYLEHTLVVMGFPNRMINLIMKCVQTTSFSILDNGTPKGSIIPSSELRQGDPFSPYLFLLCTEGLISLLRKSSSDKSLEGVRVCCNALMINYLHFVDDSLIFCKANHEAFQ